MSATMTTAEQRGNGETLVETAAEGVERVRYAANGEVGRLIADVEDLVKKVAHVTDAEIARVRDKVAKTLVATRESVQQGAVRVRESGRKVANVTDTYVHERPWTALGIAAAVGLLVGVLSARR